MNKNTSLNCVDACRFSTAHFNLFNAAVSILLILCIYLFCFVFLFDFQKFIFVNNYFCVVMHKTLYSLFRVKLKILFFFFNNWKFNEFRFIGCLNYSVSTFWTLYNFCPFTRQKLKIEKHFKIKWNERERQKIITNPTDNTFEQLYKWF